MTEIPDLGINPNQSTTNAWDNPLITHELHNSHLETLSNKCAKAFEWDFVNGMANSTGRGDSYKADRGWAGHKVIEEILGGKLRDGSSIMDLTAQIWTDIVAPSLSPEDEKNEHKLYAAWFQDIVALNGFIQTRVDTSRITSEKSFRIPELSDIVTGISKGWSFSGRMDLAEWNVSTSSIKIFDYKFRDRLNTENNKKSIQPVSYAIAANYFGYRAEFSFLETVRGQVHNQRIPITPERFEFFGERVRQAIAMIESGFFPMHTGGWWCSQKYCRHWSYCRGRYEQE